MSRATHTNEAPDADQHVAIDYPAERGSKEALRLGAHARLRSGTVLYQGSVIGIRFATGHGVVVREDCRIGDDSSVWTGSVVDYGSVLGDRVKIHSNCYIAQYSVLEDDVFIGPGVTFANDLYPGNERSAQLMRGPHVAERAQIGAGSTILPYVHIGAGALVGAGAVVTSNVPEGVVAYGCPARVQGRVEDLLDIDDRLANRET